MVSEHTRSVAERARRVYDMRLRAALEAEYTGRYVAVEPESGDYFVADTLDAAADAAQSAHPARQSHILRVGGARGRPAHRRGLVVTGRVDGWFGVLMASSSNYLDRN